MSKQFSVRGICELALQVVAEYSVHDQAADADSLKRTLDWFEVSAAEIYGTEETLWVAEENALIDIPANPNPFDFVTAAGPDVIDPGRFQIAKEALYVDKNTNRRWPLTFMWRQEWESIESPTVSGTPSHIYIDRRELLPRAYLYPNVVVENYQLGLSYYTTSPTYTVRGAHEFPGSWQKYIALKVAREIGDGPVVTLPDSQLDRLDKRIQRSHEALTGKANRQTRTVKRVRAKDI